ncbi:UDP-3-O-(3-hydroxymyristoyl)glucosamine N-acyltransferase [Calditrichota bacterium]
MRSVPIMAGELAAKIDCELSGDDLLIEAAATMTEAAASDLTFLANKKYTASLGDCQAGAIIIAPEVNGFRSGITRLLSDNPYEAFRKAIQVLYPEDQAPEETVVHPSAVIDEDAKIGRGVFVGSNCCVEAGAEIGDGCKLESGVYLGKNCRIGKNSQFGISATVREDVIIGDRCIIGDSTVVGYDGFGYTPGSIGWTKIKAVGTVIIGNDVEIGANCCIDRATVGATRIADGCKLDNLIQIAHGVQIGEHTAIAAQVGISGSTVIGKGVMLAGQAGFVGHIEIGDGMIVGAQAGVTRSFDTGGMISGYPARPQMEAMRIEAALNKLPELLKRVKRLEDELGGDEN